MHVNIYFLSALVAVVLACISLYQLYRNSNRNTIQEIVAGTFHKIMEETIDPLKERVSIVETKMEVFWKEIAWDMAKVLHHPEASRQRVDELLDVLMSDSMTECDQTELTGYLETIRDWEPGRAAPFRIFPGEQVAAAILLHTLKYMKAGIDGGPDASGN